jgi:hypothetical protein
MSRECEPHYVTAAFNYIVVGRQAVFQALRPPAIEWTFF